MPSPKQRVRTDVAQPSPPAYRKMPRRPSSKKRRKETGENEERQLGKKINTLKKCDNCGKMGHNKKGCKNPTVIVPSKSKRRQKTTSTQDELVLTQGHPQPSQSERANSSTATATATTPSTTSATTTSQSTTTGTTRASAACNLGVAAMEVPQMQI
ncbi:hypothetical protein vseg_012029 [Gypsophila vaccaria]